MSSHSETYVVFSDLVGSTAAPPETSINHIQASTEALLGDGNDVRETDEGKIQKVADELKVEYMRAERAVEAVLRLVHVSRALNDNLTERISLDVGSAEGAFLYQTKARAKRMLDMCPNGHIICSKDVIDRLNAPSQAALQISRYYLMKLQSFDTPVVVCFIGDTPNTTVRTWQTAARPRPGARTLMAMLSAGKLWDAIAVVAVAPVYKLFRDQGLHRVGSWMFGAARFISHPFAGFWPQLQYQATVGLADELMLRQRAKCISLTRQNLERAKSLDDETYVCFSTYQIGHCMAHLQPSLDAENYFLAAYRQAEEMAEPWFAGWSTLYWGRSLRGRGKFAEAEQRIISSIVIMTSVRDIRLKRHIGYAIVQMARLRVAQARPEQAFRYLNLARAIDPSAIRAPDDAPWETPLREIQEQLTTIPRDILEASVDPLYPLITDTVAYLRNLSSSRGPI